MKTKKTILYIIISFMSLYLLYVLILFALAFGHQKKSQIVVPQELKELKKEIETKKIEIVFYEISETDLIKCNAKLETTLRIADDLITISKDSLDKYINFVNNRINQRLKNKNCIDSLIIDVNVYKSKNGKSTRYRYSFPIIK